MTDLEKRIKDIKTRYGDLLSQKEFMEAAGISSRTAYLATKSGKVPYRKEWIGSVRYYRIRAEDVAHYMEERFESQKGAASSEKIDAVTTILAAEPDVLSIRQASRITGIHKNSIAKWIQRGYVTAFRWRGDYRIPKSELIRYIASPRYWNTRTNSLQRKAIKMAMEWLNEQHNNINTHIRREDNDDINKGSD